MKIFVIGGAGFIGHKVVLCLQDMGHDVYSSDGLVNVGLVPPNDITTWNNNLLRHSRIFNFKHTPYWIHNSQLDELTNIIIDVSPDIVIHIASLRSPTLVDTYPHEGISGLTSGLLNSIAASKASTYKKFVYISSSAVYGQVYQKALPVTSDCSPTSLYGIYKLAGEKLVKHLHPNHRFTILRPGFVYGPGDTNYQNDYTCPLKRNFHQAIKNETMYISNDGRSVDFTYIDDCARGIALAAVSDNTDNKTYNISRGKNRTLLETAIIVRDTVGRGTINLSPADTVYSDSDLSIINEFNDFNFQPTIDLEDGIKETWEWMRQKITT